MANNYRIEIEISKVAQETSAVSGNTEGSATAEAKATAGKGKSGLAMGFIAAKKVKGYVDKFVSHEVSMVGLRTGSNEMQERANFISSTVNKGIDIVSSIAIGAATGGVAGALIGAGVSIVSTAVSYAFAQDRLNTEKIIEDESIRRNYVRAGARGSR